MSIPPHRNRNELIPNPERWLMTQNARRNTIIGLAAILVSGIILGAMIVHANAMSAADDQAVTNSNTGESAPIQVPNLEVPPPKQEPCLSCHINGENKNLWTPVGRWAIFGTFGLVFAFGIYRSASVWTQKRPWKPITTRVVDWVDDRYDVKKPMEKILKKPVPKFALRWWYCLGGMTAFLFVVQGITGIMLAFYYKPSAAEAYASIQFIETQVRFGAAIRMIHSWSANGMIVLCVAHMLRVFIMGAYKAPRELNWVSGVVLLLLTLVFGFTGYLLPWDQRAYWATTVGTDIAGTVPAIGSLVLVMLRVGWDVSEATIGRFYGLHVIVTPLLTLTFMLAHFMMIRKLGIKKPL
ncbi:MAG: cytochrome b N-terminal domain-containing protein [Anaerolineales bacterium]